ncbi:MAG: cysteine desulfurase [Chloroflexi bacterium]|nr:cysteine desulfurase [Chloroflexota bacterium]
MSTSTRGAVAPADRAAPLDTVTLRRDFPILAQAVRGKPLVYLDNAATSQKPQVVIEAVHDYYTTTNANIHRGIHYLSEKGTAAYEDARVRISTFINARRPHEVVFTRGTTDGINMVARAWGDENIASGDEILLTEVEHHSNLVPWQALAKRRGARLRFIPTDGAGVIDLDAYGGMLGPQTKLVAVHHVSNVLGVIAPVAEMARLAHEHGAVIAVDGAQSAPHMPVDVQALDVDFLTFSGHKMAGPTGIGILYGKEALLDAMEPAHFGGSMIRMVELESSTWADLPDKFEGGTPNIAGAIGLGVAVDYLKHVGMDAINAHSRQLGSYAVNVLSDMPGVTVHGPDADGERGGVVSFTVNDLHPHDVGTVLDGEGIAIRAGHHCAQPLMRKLGVHATARASVYLYNTTDEIDRLVEGVDKAQRFFGTI